MADSQQMENNVTIFSVIIAHHICNKKAVSDNFPRQLFTVVNKSSNAYFFMYLKFFPQ